MLAHLLASENAMTAMDWISQNLIDFTPKKFGVTIEVSWGFVIAYGVMRFFLYWRRLDRFWKKS